MLSLKQPLPVPMRPAQGSGVSVPGSGMSRKGSAGVSFSPSSGGGAIASSSSSASGSGAASNLTPWEQREIREYQARNAVFYTGCENMQRKVFASADLAAPAPLPMPGPRGSAPPPPPAAGAVAPAVYDDADGHYKLVTDDHLAYRYQILEVLGKGSFGKVIRARDHKTNTEVAVKVVKNRPAERHASDKELQLLRTLASHSGAPYSDRVVKLLDSFLFRGHLCIVLELLHLNLWSFLEQNRRRLPAPVVRVLVRDTLQALMHLHAARLIHCDVKPENLVLTIPTPPDSVVHLDHLHCKLVRELHTECKSALYMRIY